MLERFPKIATKHIYSLRVGLRVILTNIFNISNT